VQAGQPIGRVGHTGNTYGAPPDHLHFEMRLDDIYDWGHQLDPLQYIS
jgi:murein DD-endopeptidase MepM/ murein hydrolase activator NlpD